MPTRCAKGRGRTGMVDTRAAGPHRGCVLGVDLGGTKGLFAAVDAGGATLLERRYACRDFDGFGPMLDAFLAALRAARGGSARPRAACIGMAGPVAGRRARLTNLPWALDADAIAVASGIARVELVNDFVAAAAGIAGLAPDATRVLQAGAPQADGVRVVLGAGTGLGVATLVPRGRDWRVIAGEGGHVGFAPRDALDLALWQALHARDPRVTVERLVSGPGLVAIYALLRERRGASVPDPLLGTPEPAASIASVALAAAGASGTGGPTAAPPDATHAAGDVADDAVAALDRFATLYGAFAGDLALLSLPRGGVFVAGGIAPRVFDARRVECFMAAFRDKGGHAPLASAIPVRLVTDPSLGVRGAAALAARAAAGRGGRQR